MLIIMAIPEEIVQRAPIEVGGMRVPPSRKAKIAASLPRRRFHPEVVLEGIVPNRPLGAFLSPEHELARPIGGRGNR